MWTTEHQATTASFLGAADEPCLIAFMSKQQLHLHTSGSPQPVVPPSFMYFLKAPGTTVDDLSSVWGALQYGFVSNSRLDALYWSARTHARAPAASCSSHATRSCPAPAR